MKRLLIILLLLPCVGFGQILVDTNKVWSVVVCGAWGGCGTVSYKFGAEITIDTLQYRELLHTYDSTLTNWNVHGSAMREDSTGKVYFHDGNGEYVMYDFSLSVNDTFKFVPINCFPSDLEITAAGSIQLLNNETRSKISLDGMIPNEDWIDGIGSTAGLIHVAFYTCWFDIGWELLCFRENDTLKYMNPNYNTCYYTSVGINEQKAEKPELFIHPNPTTGTFTVQGATGTIQVYDLFGRLVFTATEPTIDMSSYPAGIYMVRAGEAVRKLILH